MKTQQHPTGYPSGSFGRAVLRKVSWRVLPLLGLGYGIAYVDRVNISFAALQMNQDLHFSNSVYGFGAGLFSLGYCLLEVPSNLLLTRFGARRWISRIMATWGLLAIGMMFVTTPMQFYIMRLLLGIAEAGFFPGVLFYLKQWYPAASSGRAISRFYIAVPLSAAFMGAVSGPLLNLHGSGGLSGWQWLFLVEGLPAVVLGAIIFFALPDDPRRATWLDDRERSWLLSRLAIEPAEAADASSAGAGNRPLLEAWVQPWVWKLGACNFLIMGSSYAFAFSAPALLKGVTAWEAGRVGLFMSATALVGGAAMLWNGRHSDVHGERHLHVALPLGVMAVALTAVASARSAAVILPAYVVYYAGTYAVQSAFWPIPSNALRGRAAAVGLGVVGSLGLFGGFIGPTLYGMARDHTGSYRMGQLTLAVLYLAAAAGMLALRRPEISYTAGSDEGGV